MTSHRNSVVVVLVLAAGCGRTALLSLPVDAADGTGDARDAGPVRGVPDAGPDVHADARDGAKVDAVDGVGRVRRITKIAAGSYTACALKADGTVMCWAAWDGRATAIPDATQATDIAVIAGVREPSYPYNPRTRGWDDFCVTMPGKLACNSSSGLKQTMDIDALSISVGVDQTCAVSKAGQVTCYGSADDLNPIKTAVHSQGGSRTPVEVPGMQDVVQVSAGYGQVCTLLAGGKTSCFGRVLGDDGFTDAALPQTMSVPRALDVSAADEHYCVVTTEGEVACRGCIYNGGTSGPDFSCGSDNANLAALGQRRAQQIRTSCTHRCARLADGAVRCWGSNDYGELGFVAPSGMLPSHDVDGLAGAIDVAVGVHFSCALTATDDVYCWGGDLVSPERSMPNFRRIADL
jgi:alpha-tubulin suppressor-like RCC1 family protein